MPNDLALRGEHPNKTASRQPSHAAKSDFLLDIRNLRIEALAYPPSESLRTAVLVDDISLTLQRGRVLGLIGESGAGKSTIGLASMGYCRGGVRITGGEVMLNGRDIRKCGIGDMRRLRGREICYVAQSAAAAFNPALSLMDQVVESALLHGASKREEAEDRAISLFRKLSLPDPENIGKRFPHQVSGGQLQRIMTAMALCSNPDLIVFDEPTTALDVTTQIDVLAAIRDAIRDADVAALYITHDLAIVAQVADEIMVLRHGKLVERGTTQQIINEPREQYTRALVSVHQIAHDEKEATLAPVMSVEGVSAGYGGGAIKVLSDVSLELHPGQTLAVVGESGSGKSTLGRVITGLLPSSGGTIRFEGRELPRRLAERSKEDLRQIQMIHQTADIALNPRQTVATIIGRPLEFYFGIGGRERDHRVADLLDKIEMGTNFADRYPAELSGGQKQRVCIARALAAQPTIIVCDEVTSALDPLVANGILKLLLQLQKEDAVAYLLITHDLATVKSIADSIAVMYKGRVVRYGPSSQVLVPPFDPYTELLLSSAPQMEVGWLDKAIGTRRMESAGN
ncbi:ABC transporter ATP-binding protein [Mesorhizobium sp. M0134]|uniref:ABC transporter ATP-binding protein n=1 Tax=Mesorhizobium sp. M0134 TaxID=2956889 RepID=UPI0033393CF5